MDEAIVVSCSDDISSAPSEVKILPLGLVKSQKGDFVVDDESFKSMKESFIKRGLDIVVDYEHQTLENTQAPAAGWIKDIQKTSEAIIAKVEWNQAAEQYLKNKEYRYLSPVVLVRNKDKKATVLHSVALTNTPAIDGMFAIVNSLKINQIKGGSNMDLEKLVELLRLEEGATEEDILKAIQDCVGENEAFKAKACEGNKEEIVANKQIQGLLGVGANAKTEDVAAAIMALKNPSNFVPVEDFNKLKERLDKKDSEGLVLKALKSGKISAAQKEWAEEYALKDPTGFEKFVEKSPQIVPMGEINLNEPTVDVMSDTTMAVCKMLGVSKEDVEKFNKNGDE